MKLATRRTADIVFVLLLWLGWSRALAAPPEGSPPPPVSFEIAPVPKWVKPIVPARMKKEMDSGGISYLLTDQQENVEPRAAYYHESRQITSENGVQNGSAITVSFDPSYQKLVFHFIRVVRNGVAVERLDRSRIQLLQREKDMEEFLFDGAYTANCQLEDVRVDDVIELAYTINGDNPVKKGKYSGTFATDWPPPVHRAITRFVYPASRKLEFRPINRAIKPAITTENGVTEWLLEQSDIPGRKADPETPPGYDPCGWVQVSEWASWEQVIDWAIPLYQTDALVSNELEAEILKLKGILDPEQRILTALRFVQDEIRYLGIESGVSSHRPTAPSEVLRRRFGDCKDKATLLCTLLRRAGIDASPALVSNAYRNTVSHRLPSPGAFDHVIVQVRTDKETHWLDATRSGQRGPLSQIYITDFGCALVVRPGNQTLTPFGPPPGSQATKKVVENYRISKPGESAQLEVISEYHGRWAEETRSRFREKNREKIQKEYLQYYARRFSDVRTSRPLQYEELPDESGCRTREFYSIPNIWQLNDDRTKYELFLYPGELAHDMGSAGSSQRDDPLALDYPISTAQEINAEMFADWSLDLKNQSATNAFFRFRDEAKASGRRLQFKYLYESLTDRVSTVDLPAYNAALSKVKDSIGYTLSYRTPAQLTAIGKWLDYLNWPIAVLLGCVFAMALFISAWVVYKSALPAPLPPLPMTLPSLEGIGGWLALVAIHHILRPIGFVINLGTLFPTVLSLPAWRLLTEPGHAEFHPYWAPALIFELFYNSLCLIFSGLLLVLFFQKRAAWRRYYVMFFIVLLVGVGLDAWFVQQIPGAGGSVAGTVRELVGAIVAAVIWIPYCIVSKRVRATFRY